MRERKGGKNQGLLQDFLLSTTRKMMVLSTEMVLASGRENKSCFLSLLFEIGEDIDTIGFKSVG